MLDNTIQIVVSYDRIHVKRRRVGWGHHNITLPRAPQGDKTALCADAADIDIVGRSKRRRNKNINFVLRCFIIH